MPLDAVFGSPLPPIQVEADRHLLRPFRHEDVRVVEEASRDDVIPSITSVPADWTAERGLDFIDRQNRRLADGEGWSLAIVERESGIAVGQIGLWIAHLHKGRAEIGYWVARPCRGRGAAADAVRSLSEWAFDRLDVDRLSLFIEPWNAASIATAKRSGYEREGLLRGWERVGGVPRDMWSYVRLRPRS